MNIFVYKQLTDNKGNTKIGTIPFLHRISVCISNLEHNDQEKKYFVDELK